MPLNLPDMDPAIPREMFPTQPTGWQAGILGGIQGLNQGIDKYTQMKQLQQQMAIKELDRQIKSAQAKYAEPMEQAKLKRAQTLAENPLLGSSGIAGQIGAALYAEKHGVNLNDEQKNQAVNEANKDTQNYIKSNNIDTNSPSAAKLIINNAKASLQRNVVDMQLKEQQAKGYTWAHMPVETKNFLTAQAAGMGIDPMDMQKYVNEGLNIKQIAQRVGLDPENIPTPVYFPTTATKTRVQQVQQVTAEIDYLSSATSQFIKPYANTFKLPLLGTISPQAYRDMFGDKKQQYKYGEYMGALALQTGLATGRSVAEGNPRPGVEIMREIRDKSLAGIAQQSPVRMTDVMYEAAQKTINKLLQKGAKIRTLTGMSPYSKAIKDGLENNNKEEKTLTYNPKTGRIE